MGILYELKVRVKASYIDDVSRMDGGNDAVLPLHQVVDVGANLVRFSVEVLQPHARDSARPTLAGDLAVQLRKVGLLDRFAPINIALHSAKFVAEPFRVISAFFQNKKN